MSQLSKCPAPPVPKILDVTAAATAHASDVHFYDSIDWGVYLARGFDYLLQNGIFYHLNKWGAGDRVRMADIAPHGSPYKIIEM